MLNNDKSISGCNLFNYQTLLDTALVRLREESILSRIWAMDHTVWNDNPQEITNRLGWLQVARGLDSEIPRIEAFVQSVRDAGYTQVLLLGMGGSSLAPEVVTKSFGVRQGYLDLAVLDSTDPGAVLDWVSRLNLAQTLFVVSTKSGRTVETFSFFKYFYNLVAETVGVELAGEHFIAITDPGSGLAETATSYHFRETFLNDPHIGGRYSALSYFGLVPAALIGVDLSLLLKRATDMMKLCAREADNPALYLGAMLGELAKAGRDKLALIITPEISSFGDWIEQLIAESTGKNGKGILPVAGESPAAPDVYGDDRLFVFVGIGNGVVDRELYKSLEAAGHPLLENACLYVIVHFDFDSFRVVQLIYEIKGGRQNFGANILFIEKDGFPDGRVVQDFQVDPVGDLKTLGFSQILHPVDEFPRYALGPQRLP